MAAKHLFAGLLSLEQKPWRRIFGGLEVDHLPQAPFSIEPTLSVAAPRSLGYGVQARQGAVNRRKIEVNPSFDQLGADHPHGGRPLESRLDV